MESPAVVLKNDVGVANVKTTVTKADTIRVAEDGKRVIKWEKEKCLFKDNSGYIHVMKESKADSLSLQNKGIKLHPYDPVFIQNKWNQYLSVKAQIACNMIGANIAQILQINDPDYIDGVKLAMGIDPRSESISSAMKSKSFVQKNGKPMDIEDLGKFDVLSTLKDAEAMVKNLKTDSSGLITEEIPPVETFEGKRGRGRPRKNI